jgi:hypothetical protein
MFDLFVAKLGQFGGLAERGQRSCGAPSAERTVPGGGFEQLTVEHDLQPFETKAP